MVLFAEYCFNKSHSTAYGAVTYQTAYLKAHYPVAYMAALLTVNAGTYRQGAALHRQLQRHGHRGDAAGCECLRHRLHPRG